MNHKIRLVDYVPPILVPFLMKIKSHFNPALLDTGDSPVAPFVSPVLNSYSQFNEDLIIDLLFESKRNGFYLDVGANDPSSCNNTKRFYDKGWSGINIEPGKDAFEKLCACRPRDINLNIGVGFTTGTLTFYQVDENPQLSSFDKNIATTTAAKLEFTVEEIQIAVFRLVDVFEHHVKDKQVDFMSLDAEGLDLEVLQSNDWDRFRPTFVIVEIDKGYRDIVGYMKYCNYILIYNNEHNGIFIDKKTSDNNVRRVVCID
jgi:FkbM family methyltransferase